MEKWLKNKINTILNSLIELKNLKDKNILVVWGGWEGHKPELFVKHIEKWLIFEEANYKIHNGIEAYNSYEELIKYDLIIQSITMSKISKEQENNLLKAIKNGVGIVTCNKIANSVEYSNYKLLKYHCSLLLSTLQLA